MVVVTELPTPKSESGQGMMRKSMRDCFTKLMIMTSGEGGMKQRGVKAFAQRIALLHSGLQLPYKNIKGLLQP